MFRLNQLVMAAQLFAGHPESRGLGMGIGDWLIEEILIEDELRQNDQLILKQTA